MSTVHEPKSRPQPTDENQGLPPEQRNGDGESRDESRARVNCGMAYGIPSELDALIDRIKATQTLIESIIPKMFSRGLKVSPCRPSVAVRPEPLPCSG